MCCAGCSVIPEFMNYYSIHLIVLFILAINSFRDIRVHEICPGITILGGVIGLIFRYVWGSGQILSFLASMLPGIYLVLLSIVSRGAVGAGDGLILLALSGYLPAADIISIVSYGVFLSALYAGALLMRGRNGRKAYAFVPFLLGGYVLHLLTQLAR